MAHKEKGNLLSGRLLFWPVCFQYVFFSCFLWNSRVFPLWDYSQMLKTISTSYFYSWIWPDSKIPGRPESLGSISVKCRTQKLRRMLKLKAPGDLKVTHSSSSGSSASITDALYSLCFSLIFLRKVVLWDEQSTSHSGNYAQSLLNTIRCQSCTAMQFVACCNVNKTFNAVGWFWLSEGE